MIVYTNFLLIFAGLIHSFEISNPQNPHRTNELFRSERYKRILDKTSYGNIYPRTRILVNVSIGTPPQSFKNELDFYIPVTHVLSSNFKDPNNNTFNLFDESASTTNVVIKEDPVNSTHYVAHFDRDTFNIGAGTYTDIPFMVVEKDDYEYQHSDGILGIGDFQDDSNETTWNGLVKSLKNKMWTLTENGNSEESIKLNGKLTLGDVDTELCSNDYVWVKQTDKYYFEFDAGDVLIDAERIVSKANVYVDTTFHTFYTSEAVVNKVVSLTNARWNETFNRYFVDCNLKVDNNLAVQITIGTEKDQTIKLALKDYIYEYVNNQCVLEILGDSDEYWSIGIQTFKNNCFAVNFDTHQLGFSQHK